MNEKEVFVTYSWDNDEHSSKVLALTNFLRQNGFVAEVDRMLIQEESAIDFKSMMHQAMTKYKKVIIVLSEGYKKKAENFEGGVGNEYSLILSDFDINKDKYILVSFEGFGDNIKPLFFQNKEIINLEGYNPYSTEKLFRKLMDSKEFSFSPVSASKPSLESKPIPAIFHNSENEIVEYLDYNQISDLIDFSNTIKNEDKINILKLLNLPLSNFKNVSSYISQNPNDVRNGVKEVYIKGNLNIFSVFESCVLKILENGSKEYHLYVETSDINKIVDIYENLSLSFGVGIYDDRRANTFQDISKIKEIANGYVSSPEEECHAMWSINDVFTIWLSYHVSPLKQFSLLIDEKKIVERPNISRNDSILNYISFDLKDVIKKSREIFRDVQDGKVRFIDYIANLPKPFLDIFTKVKIRIFDINKEFDKDVQIHLFFYKKNNVFKVNDIKIISSKLWDIYGCDNNDYGLIRDYEITNAEKFGNWNSGRTYYFDNDHKIWNKNSDGIPLYQVEVEYSNYSNEGLCLTVIAFNELVKYMNQIN